MQRVRKIGKAIVGKWWVGAVLTAMVLTGPMGCWWHHDHDHDHDHDRDWHDHHDDHY